MAAKLTLAANVNAADEKGDTPLYWATMNNNRKIVAELIRRGADVNAAGDKGNTPLHLAAMNNNTEIATELIRRGADINAVDNEGNTPLRWAARKNNTEIATELIRCGADINAANKEGNTPLHLAARKNNAEIAAELIRRGADVNTADKKGITPLHWATLNNNTEIAAELIRRGADVNAADEIGDTPLHSATINDITEIAAELIRRGADVNAADKIGYTPLYWTTRNNNTKIGAELIRHGADVNAAVQKVVTPLHWATIYNNTEFAAELIRRGDDVNAANEEGDTPLHWAMTNNTEIAVELIRRGADVNATDEKGDTPLHWASINNNTEIAAELIRRGANVNAANEEGDTSLHLAMTNNNTEIVVELIRRGADVNATNMKGDTPLHWAIGKNNKEAAATLLDFKADFFIENKIGSTPLIYAHSHSDKDIFFNICQRIQCNPLSLNYNGDPYFHAAVKFCFNETLDISDSSGFNLEFVLKMRGLNGNSPLHYWATAQFDCGLRLTEFGERLIELEVQLNARNDKDETPLHVAMSWRAVDLLLGKGAWPNVKSEPNGDTPLLTRANHIKESSANFYDGFCPETKTERSEDVLVKEWRKVFEKGMDPLITNYNGVSLLKILIDKKNFELANALVTFQTKRSAADSKLTSGDTILHIICEEGKDELQTTIDNLLKSSVNVNCLNATKQTALHLVCKGISGISGDKENVASTMLYWTASRLLAFGADPTLKDCDGVSCFDIAEYIPELSELLKEPIDISTIPQMLKWSDPKSKKHKHVIAQVVRNQNSIQVESFHYHKTPIGSGGFGHVFAGVDTRDGREIAMKRIEKHRLRHRHDKREISTLIKIQDCGEIVRYHCHHEDDHFVYLILDLMEGTLIDYLSSEDRDSSNDVTLCRDVMKGLNFLHQNKVLHRDIKPGNILYKFCPRICLKLADFDLSSQVTSSSTFSVMHTAAGTRCWMAPELLLQTGGIKHTEASDVFSCGLILHFLLAEKRHPFINPSSPKLGSLAEQSEIEQAILNWKLFLHEDLTPEARDLIQKMMHKNKSDRPKATYTLQHPFFWSQEKRKDFIVAVGNQPKIECPRNKVVMLSFEEQKLETTLGKRPEVSIGWENSIPSFLYSEISTGHRKYDASSAVELVRFVRNCYAHASDRKRTSPAKTLILRHKLFEMFPTLIIDVYNVVVANGWDMETEIKNVLKIE